MGLLCHFGQLICVPASKSVHTATTAKADPHSHNKQLVKHLSSAAGGDITHTVVVNNFVSEVGQADHSSMSGHWSNVQGGMDSSQALMLLMITNAETLVQISF